MYRLC